MTKEYVGHGATLEEQRLNRARALVAREHQREDARKLKLSTRTSRLELLRKAAEKRARRCQRNVLHAELTAMGQLAAKWIMGANTGSRNAPDR